MTVFFQLKYKKDLKLVCVSGESCTYGQQTVEEEFCKRDPKQLWLQAVLVIQ